MPLIPRPRNFLGGSLLSMMNGGSVALVSCRHSSRTRKLTLPVLRTLLCIRLIIQIPLLGSYMRKSAWSTGIFNIGSPNNVVYKYVFTDRQSIQEDAGKQMSQCSSDLAMLNELFLLGYGEVFQIRYVTVTHETDLVIHLLFDIN